MSVKITVTQTINLTLYYVTLCAITLLLLPSKGEAQTRSTSKSKTTKDQASQSTKSNTNPKSNTSSHQPTEADNPINAQSFNESLLSRLVFDLTNIERRRAGLSEFKNNQYLHESATGHSRDMAARNYFEHKSKGFFKGTAPRDRIEATGYAPSMSAENIAMIPIVNSQRVQSYPGRPPQIIEMDVNSYNRMAVYSVTQWMESPGHRKNILNPALKDMGVGVAVGMKDTVAYVYLTQNFGG